MAMKPMQIIRAQRQAASKFIQTRKASSTLFDSFGRIHDYLRISLTEKCNLRCTYCMPAEGITLTQSDQLLQIDELKKLSRIFVTSCGIKKIRLTGGEPTIDRKLLPVIEYLNQLRNDGLETIAMTTNGLTLKRSAAKYKELGVNAINISLDSLNPERYELMSRRKGWPLVMDGIKRALDVNFDSVKLNCVVMRNYNDDELVDFCKLAFQHPIDIRFIEFMPFHGNKWRSDTLVSFDEMLGRAYNEYPALERMKSRETAHETCKIYKDPNMLGSIGFITSMTNNFCSGCNRLRLTADGQLRVCLFDHRETSLRDLLRNGASDSELIVAIQLTLAKKKRQHAGGLWADAKAVRRPMIKIGSMQARLMHGGSSTVFSHLDREDKVRMVNIANKHPVRRFAVARGQIYVGNQVLDLIKEKRLEKGDIITVAKAAGIMGAKQTSNLIPMCHQVPLNHVQVDICECTQRQGTLLVEAIVESDYKTGVEMECLTAVSIALLTIYDMCKSANKSMQISNIHLVAKRKNDLEFPST